jgi:ankyrin repeat protein
LLQKKIPSLENDRINTMRTTKVTTNKIEKANYDYMPLSIELLANPGQVIHAAATGNLELLQKLFEFSPNLANSLDWYGNTALIHGVRGDHQSVVQFLLDSDLVDINHQNSGGETALMVGSRFCCEKSVLMLLSYHANAMLVNNVGDTAFSIAEMKDYLNIVAILNKIPDETSVVSKSKEMFFSKKSDKQESILEVCTVKIPDTNPIDDSNSVEHISNNSIELKF